MSMADVHAMMTHNIEVAKGGTSEVQQETAQMLGALGERFAGGGRSATEVQGAGVRLDLRAQLAR
ncbi:hypothetical protein [Polymorphobacter sp.]|uniref:hypothetical protein n=1 Tax=Polymorphobacter sp. TaxID=1909290 RepID=UPI003F70D77D